MIILVIVSADCSVLLQLLWCSLNIFCTTVLIIVFVDRVVLLIGGSVRRLMLIMRSRCSVAIRRLCWTAMKVIALFITCMCYLVISCIRVFPIEDICGWSRPIFDFYLPVLSLMQRLILVWALYLSIELVVNRSCLLHLNHFVVSLHASSVLFLSLCLSLCVCLYLIITW